MTDSPALPAPSTPVAQLTERASAWLEVSLAPHPDRAVAFRLDDATIGVLHHEGRLEVPVPPPIRTILVNEGLAQPHPTRSDDWVAAQVQATEDVEAAALLLRLSYLYRRLLRSQDPVTLRRIRLELAQYALPDALATLYETMLAKRDVGPSSPSDSSLSSS